MLQSRPFEIDTSVEHQVHAAVGVEAIQRAGAAPVVDRHRAGPEAAGGIALAVVHAPVGVIGFDTGDRPHAAGARIEPRKPVADGEERDRRRR